MSSLRGGSLSVAWLELVARRSDRYRTLLGVVGLQVPRTNYYHLSDRSLSLESLTLSLSVSLLSPALRKQSQPPTT